MNLFCFCSGKGGTGKTLTAINLAFACSEFTKVKLIEADFWNSNMRFYLSLPKDSPSLNDALEGKKQPHETVINLNENLEVVCASYASNPKKGIDFSKTTGLIKKLVWQDETVFLDLSPGLNEDVMIPLKEFQNAVIVTNPESAAVADCLKLVEICSALGIKVKGTILNRVGRFQEELKEKEITHLMKKTPILGKIPEDPRIPESAAYGEPIIQKYPEAETTLEFKKIAKALYSKSD